MGPFNLKNNAMFLSCWHERNRPVQLVCFGILTASVLLLAYLSISIYPKSDEATWRLLFSVIATVQALVLLLQGSSFIGYLASRERISETLDFHRNSPQPVREKILGLVFGGAWFEWMIFAILFAIELPFALLPKINLIDIVLFNLSIALTGIFFHTTSAAFSLVSSQKKRSSPILIIMAILIFGAPLFGLIITSTQSTFFAYLFGAVSTKYLIAETKLAFQGWFYTLTLPVIVLQALVQVPLAMLMAKGMGRIFSMPNSPAWSKKDMLSFCFFVFFMITGFLIANYTHFEEIKASRDNYRYYNYFSAEGFVQNSSSLYIVLFTAVGILISFCVVPTYFKRSKYVVLRRQNIARRNGLFDDGASSFPFILVYLLIGALFLVPYFIIPKISALNAMAALSMVSCHIIAFAGFQEFFRLGRFRGNNIFFVTTLIIWWVFLPWFMSIIFHIRPEDLINIASGSPFLGISYAIELIKGEQPKLIPLIAPCLFAVITWLLAWQEHQSINQRSKG